MYAALVAIINTKFPQIGELIAKRLIQQFRRAFRRNDKNTCLSSVQFVAHLVNQQVTHELLALELLTVLLEDPSSDSVEVAVGFLKECGQKLTQLSPRGVHGTYSNTSDSVIPPVPYSLVGVFESIKGILRDGNVDVRVQYMIEVMFAIRKDGFKEHPAIVEGLDLVDEEDQITHLLSLEDDIEGEERLSTFHHTNSSHCLAFSPTQMCSKLILTFLKTRKNIGKSKQVCAVATPTHCHKPRPLFRDAGRGQ